MSEGLLAVRRELRLAARSLRRSPAFAAGAGVTLALAIGATTAVWTLLDRVALRPLPYEESERLVAVAHPVPGLRADAVWGLSQAGYFFLWEENRVLEELGVYVPSRVNLADEAGPALRADAVLASGSLLAALRAPVALGRPILDEDNRPGSTPVAVLGHDHWMAAHGGDPGVVGRTIRVNSTAHEIVGVLGPGFHLPDRRVDVWLPLELNPEAPAVNAHYLNAIGRLRPGTSRGAAGADLARLTALLPDRFPGAYSPSFMESYEFRTHVLSLRDQVVGGTAGTLWIMLGAVLLVLVIAAANVANLFLARAETRRREVAIRAAMGAGRRHLLRHALTESFLLALPAGALGALLGWGALRALLALSPAGLPRLSEVRLDAAGLAVALALSLAAGLVFGLIPLLRGRDLRPLKEDSRGLIASRGQAAARRVLVVAQVALALLLLACAGLLFQTFRALRAVEPGFRPEGALAAEISLPPARYFGWEPTFAFHRELLGRAGALPGVRAAGAATDLPLVGYRGCSLVFLEDRPYEPGGEPPCVPTPLALPGYFQALGIPVHGRIPDWSDVERGTGAVVVTETLARRFWPGEDPIGKGIRPNGRAEPYYRVVGVAGDLRARGLDQPPVEAVWFPPLPLEGAPLWVPPRSVSLVLQSETGRPEEIVPSLRRVLTELDPEVALAGVRTMETVVADSLARVSFAALLLAAAAGMALVLSLVGLYAVVSYLVARRRGEIGIRMALGARVGQVARLVIRQSVGLAAAGVALGLLAAFWATRLLESHLFGVSPTDPATLIAVSLALVGLAALASLGPARRAARVDPAETLRAE